MGYSRKRTRYEPAKEPDAEEEREAREELEGLKRGPRRGSCSLKYLDESGLSMCLPPTYTWTRKGQSHQRRVRTRWGSKGRINLLGTLSLEGGRESLEYSTIEGPCRSAEVVGYLDASAGEALETGEEVVVILRQCALPHGEGGEGEASGV